MNQSARRRRILLVIAGLPAGGAERQLSQLAIGLDRSEFDVGLLIFNSADKIHYREVLKIPLWFRALNLSRSQHGVYLIPKIICGIRSSIADFKPDIIHTTLNVANHAVRFATFPSGPPIVTSVRVEYRPSYSPIEKRLERLLWRRSNHIICNSDITRDQLMSDLGIPANRITTIPNGVDAAFFKEETTRPPGWPPGHVVLTVGRFTRQKNHTALIEALASLEKRDLLADWHFVFLGDGPLQETIQTTIQQHALQKRIQIMPPANNMPAIYQASDLFVLPSLYEGMSNALLEAAASDCAIIVSKEANNIGIINNERGWVVESFLQDTLETVFALTDDERAQKARSALAYIRKTYRAEMAVKKTAEVYHAVLGSN